MCKKMALVHVAGEVLAHIRTLLLCVLPKTKLTVASIIQHCTMAHNHKQLILIESVLCSLLSVAWIHLHMTCWFDNHIFL